MMTTAVGTEQITADGLGVAWSVFLLYPDPDQQPSFHRAADHLGEVIGDPVTLQVGAGVFMAGDEPIIAQREGTERLARRCFVHGIEAIRVNSAVSRRDLHQFFRILLQPEATIADSGGVEAALMRSGIDGLAVAERSALNLSGVDVAAVDRQPEVAALIEEAGDPQSLAASLQMEAGGSTERLAELFEERYTTILGQVATDDHSGREQVVQAFVETFFHFPPSLQPMVLGPFLNEFADQTHQVFLDQFAGHELARLAPRLDATGLELLFEYARVSSDQADRRTDELMALLEAPESLEAARGLIAGSVGARLPGAAADEMVDVLHAQVPDPRRFFFDALDVFRGMLHAEERPDRFSRLLRIWSGKVSAAARRGEYRRAELWLRSALEKPTYEPGRKNLVDQAVDGLATPELVELLSQAAGTESATQEAALRTLGAMRRSAMTRLIDLMADTEESGRRKHLVETLGHLAAADVHPVLERLGDTRWFVVRNLAVALGRSGNQAAVPSLEGLVRHADHRVRSETLRSLVILDKEAAFRQMTASINDSNEGVRQLAVGYLARAGSQGVKVLTDTLSKPGGTDLKLRVVKALTGVEAARPVLQGLADKRSLFSGKGRQLRKAAREALGGHE